MFNLSGALHLRGSLPHMPHLGLPGQNSHCFKAFQARRCPLRCCQAFLGHHVGPYLLVRPRFCPSRAAGDWHCTLRIPTLVGGPFTCGRCCSFVSLFFSPLCWCLDGRVINWFQVLDTATGNFNTPLVRLAALLAVCLLQAWLMYGWIMFQVKLWHPIPIIQFFGICTNIHPLVVCR